MEKDDAFVHVEIGLDTKIALKMYCAKKNVTVSEIIRQLIDEFLRKNHD